MIHYLNFTAARTKLMRTYFSPYIFENYKTHVKHPFHTIGIQFYLNPATNCGGTYKRSDMLTKDVMLIIPNHALPVWQNRYLTALAGTCLTIYLIVLCVFHLFFHLKTLLHNLRLNSDEELREYTTSLRHYSTKRVLEVVARYKKGP